METNKDNPKINASPVKSFFIGMLTRDIDLVDAILDLLDNCVDGILRQRKNSSDETPYKEFKAEIKFNEKSFSISDNCGGISREHCNYAFRMGNAREDRDRDLPTIGVYGIGMKRAIFKIGKHCLISTQNEGNRYKIEIEPKWIAAQNNWHLPISKLPPSKTKDGTTIIIDELNEDIAIRFGEGSKEAFTSELTEKVQTQYAFILDKGFEVIINGERVETKSTKLVFNEKIKPFIYQTEFDGVNVFLSVGFTRPILSRRDANDQQKEERYSSEDAGWTIICNDRAVLYCDRTELTGWGVAGAPRYHTQFIAISGIVEFQSNDTAKLPTTTTKRGIDASSSLYLQVKNKMTEGMKMFTAYTNHWKDNADESKHQIASGNYYNLDEIKKEVETLTMNPVKSGLKGEQFKRPLPRPEPKESTKKRISYNKELGEIQMVQNYLFGEKKVTPTQVGEKCFDMILEEAQ